MPNATSLHPAVFKSAKWREAVISISRRNKQSTKINEQMVVWFSDVVALQAAQQER